ncbi:hypothetical protein TrVGV298_004511 [Trichoderma virens]|nr:hypothetical protein TrVGV298_004511 [Trichoderma virens]
MAMRYGKKKPEKQDMAFYLFAKLPYDVREIIWKLAAQSRTPGAHFFSTWKLDNPLPKDRLVLDKDTGDRGTPHLATPLGDNPSAYMVERRLWRTCQESAEVMLRMRHKRAKERRKMREEKRDPGMPIFSVFFEERRRITPAEGQTTLTDRYLAMPLECFPKTDLVCFERRDLKNLLRWMNNRSEMPKFFEKRFINFGLRYDKGWDKFFWESPSSGY